MVPPPDRWYTGTLGQEVTRHKHQLYDTCFMRTTDCDAEFQFANETVLNLFKKDEKCAHDINNDLKECGQQPSLKSVHLAWPAEVTKGRKGKDRTKDVNFMMKMMIKATIGY